jgi:hypothetical protein
MSFYCKLSGMSQILAEFIQAGSTALCNFIWNKEELSGQWKESMTVPVYKKNNVTDYSNCLGI